MLDRLSPPALAMLHVTTRVLELSARVAAGDEDAAADVERLAALLERKHVNQLEEACPR